MASYKISDVRMCDQEEKFEICLAPIPVSRKSWKSRYCLLVNPEAVMILEKHFRVEDQKHLVGKVVHIPHGPYVGSLDHDPREILEQFILLARDRFFKSLDPEVRSQMLSDPSVRQTQSDAALRVERRVASEMEREN